MRRRFENFLDTIKETLIRLILGFAGALFVALATIVLIAPDAVREFIEGIPLLFRILLLLLVYAISAFIVYQEFVVGGKGSEQGLILKGDGDSVTTLDPDSARDRILATVENLPWVESARVIVHSRRGRADVDVLVTVKYDSVNLQDKQKEIVKSLSLVEKQLGLRLAGKPKIELQLMGAAGKGETAQKPVSSVSQNMPDVAAAEPQVKTLESVSKAESEAQSKADDGDEDPEFWEFLKSTSTDEDKSDKES